MSFLRTKNGAFVAVEKIRYLTELKLLRGGSAYIVTSIESNPNDLSKPYVSRFEIEMSDAVALKKIMTPLESEVSDQRGWESVVNVENSETPEGGVL